MEPGQYASTGDKSFLHYMVSRRLSCRGPSLIIQLTRLRRVFGLVNYFLCAGLSYIFVFDKGTFLHPKYLKNQIRLEIRQALTAMPIIAALTVPWFLAEIRGYSLIYDTLPKEVVMEPRWLVYLAAVPLLRRLYRFLHLLDSPRSAPQTRIRYPPQAPPQMDHAHALCVARLPPS